VSAVKWSVCSEVEFSEVERVQRNGVSAVE